MHLFMYTEICFVSAKETNTVKLLYLPSSFKATIMIWELPCGFAVTKSVVKDYKTTSAFQDRV